MQMLPGKSSISNRNNTAGMLLISVHYFKRSLPHCVHFPINETVLN